MSNKMKMQMTIATKTKKAKRMESEKFCFVKHAVSQNTLYLPSTSLQFLNIVLAIWVSLSKFLPEWTKTIYKEN
jgi:hypothetical protein